jgi:hypothetical protein
MRGGGGEQHRCLQILPFEQRDAERTGEGVTGIGRVHHRHRHGRYVDQAATGERRGCPPRALRRRGVDSGERRRFARVGAERGADSEQIRFCPPGGCRSSTTAKPREAAAFAACLRNRAILLLVATTGLRNKEPRA